MGFRRRTLLTLPFGTPWMGEEPQDQISKQLRFGTFGSPRAKQNPPASKAGPLPSPGAPRKGKRTPAFPPARSQTPPSPSPSPS
eukprot:4168360-Pyramimonas_sp.AAC.1